MKTLIITTMAVMLLLCGAAMIEGGISQGLEVQVSGEEVLQDKVKIYDYAGNLIRELSLREVSNGDIAVVDHILLESSHYAFSYLGDYYYFRD